MSAVAHSDVLVLGGGLIGAATAFFLRHAHGKSVTLLERELVGRQASGTNFGGVRRQGRTPQQMPIAHRALRTWDACANCWARTWSSAPTATCASAIRPSAPT